MFNSAGGVCDQDLLLRSFARCRFANIADILSGHREDEVALREKVFSTARSFAADGSPIA
jgi:hypothetical protein